MKFLVDANLSPRIVTILQKEGFEALHVADVDLLYASDDMILAYATAAEAVIVSADSDFTQMVALAGLKSPSLVLLRSVDRQTPEQQAALLAANLPVVEEELLAGAVISLSPEHLRARRLPLR